MASRSASLDKCFYSWDLDKKEGKIPIDEISRVLVTFRSERAKEMCACWVEMTAKVYEVKAALRKASLRGGEKRYLQPEDLKKHLVQQVLCSTDMCGPLGGDLDWDRYMVVVKIEDDPETHVKPPASLFTINIQEISPIILPDVEKKIVQILNDAKESETEAIVVSTVNITSPPVSVDGLSKNEARKALLEITSPLKAGEFENFTTHILATLDFVYDISQHNQRNRMMWELFKIWDSKDHGYVDASDFIRRVSNVKHVQDRSHINVQKLVEQGNVSTDDISLTRFKALMCKILSECSEVEVDNTIRTLRRQLESDEDTKDNRYAVCRHLRSEAEQQLKRDERLMQMAERRSSFSCSVREAAKRDIALFRKNRLESKKKHAFDSISFDDIAVLLDTSIAPPATRLTYERVASSVCILVDISPVTADGRVEYWAAFQEALRSNMVDVLTLIHDINVGSLSHVRVCRCMTVLQESSNPSHLLSLSWFLSALVEWCRACCELACLQYNWEWPPPPLQSSAAGPSTGNPRPPASSSNSSAVRSLKYRTPGKSCETSQYQPAMHKDVPESPFRASNLFARKRRPKGPSWAQFAEKQAASLSRQRSADKLYSDTKEEELIFPTHFTEVNISQYKTLSCLNESLGLPQPGIEHYSTYSESVCMVTTTPFTHTHTHTGFTALLERLLADWDSPLSLIITPTLPHQLHLTSCSPFPRGNGFCKFHFYCAPGWGFLSKKEACRIKMGQRLSGLDGFRELPVELTQATVGGGFLTMVASVVALVLFYFEAGEFMNEVTRSEVVMDTTQNEMLQIRFDIIFYDLACEYVNVGVRDSFGTERFNIEKNIKKHTIDHEGRQGAAYTAEELLHLDQEDLTPEERAEVDSDWTSSTAMMHHDFARVVDSHDFTIVLFYARATKAFPNMKCTPCKKLRPVWDTFETKVNGRKHSMITRAIQINCAEYNLECIEQKVTTLPTIRLFRRGVDALRSYAMFKPEEATVESLMEFVEKKEAEASKTAYAGYQIHEYFPTGCRVDGTVEVSRVPGSLHFEAVNGPLDNINFATTNVSHRVVHMAFQQPGDRMAKGATGVEGFDGLHPIDGRDFVVHKFHEAPHHFLTVVATNYALDNKGIYADFRSRALPLKVYQMTHQSRTARTRRDAIPSARFNYDLSPVEVKLTTVRGREWYDFFTTIFAVVGGTYSVAALLTGGLQNIRY